MLTVPLMIPLRNPESIRVESPLLLVQVRSQTKKDHGRLGKVLEYTRLCVSLNIIVSIRSLLETRRYDNVKHGPLLSSQKPSQRPQHTWNLASIFVHNQINPKMPLNAYEIASRECTSLESRALKTFLSVFAPPMPLLHSRPSISTSRLTTIHMRSHFNRLGNTHTLTYTDTMTMT